MSAILRIQDYSLTLTSNHAETAILNDINLNIYKNEIVGLIGKSGSGKTMLAMSIADLLYTVDSHQNGNIEFLDNNSGYTNILELAQKDLTAYRRSFVSFIFQDSLSALNPAKRCGWQIEEALRISQSELSQMDRRSRVIQVLRDVDLEDTDRVFKSYPYELSGGQLQRVVIAMSIIQKPQLIIADEPTSSLDQETEQIVLNLMKRLQVNYGFSLLLISHNLDLVSSFCDRIVIIEEGKMISTEDDNTSLLHIPSINQVMSKNKSTQSQTEVDICLTFHNVTHSYKKRQSLFGRTIKIPSLHDVSFSVRRSEILGLMGPSGSGKSTIAKLLTGFEFPDSGEIMYESVDLSKAWKDKSRHMRNKIQIIFQNPFSSLNPKQRVGDCIMEVMKVRGLDFQKDRKESVIQYLESVGLTDQYIDRFPRQLSGGQQQRVSIARALAIQPEMLICDECVSALDTTTKYELLDLLEQLRVDRKLTIIFISHDKRAVNYVCDRVIQIEKGCRIERVS